MPAPTTAGAPGSRVQIYITLVPRADVGSAASIGAAFQEAVSSGMMADSLRIAGAHPRRPRLPYGVRAYPMAYAVTLWRLVITQWRPPCTTRSQSLCNPIVSTDLARRACLWCLVIASRVIVIANVRTLICRALCYGAAGVPAASVRGVLFAAYPANAPVGPSDPSQYPKQGPHKFKPVRGRPQFRRIEAQLSMSLEELI